MPEQVSLAAEPRGEAGKGVAKTLRRNGRVPAVAYGSKLDATPLSVDSLELYHALHTEAGLNAIIRLSLDGETHLALVRQIQRHPVRREIQHVDFVTVDKDVKVTVDVPIHLHGEAPGTNEGGVVDQALFTLSVEVLPLEVPSELTLDISGMNVGDVKRVSDISLPDGVASLDDADRAVVSVAVPQLEVPEPGEEAELAEGEEAEEAEAGAEGAAEEAGETSDAAESPGE